MSAFRVELIKTAADIPLQRDQWNALVASGTTNTVFQTFEWFQTWWGSLGTQHQLHFLLLRDESEIVGFAPLMLVVLPTKRRQLQFVGASHADYADFVVNRDNHVAAVTALLEYLGQHRRDWDSFVLRNIPQRSPTLRLVERGLKPYGLGSLRLGIVKCPAMELRGRETQVEQLLSRYSLRRPTNWFTKRGELRLRVLTSDTEIQEQLPAFFNQHVARWQRTSTPSRFGDAQQREFFVRLAVAMRASGWLSFAVVEFNNQLLAAHFGFHYANQLIWYKPSFDPRLRQHSPGLVLIRYLIRHALDKGIAQIDFTIGDEDFKSRFATVKRSNCDVAIFVRRRDLLAAYLHMLLQRVVAICMGGPRRLLRSAIR